MTKTGIDPQTHDTKLAALYWDLAKAQQQQLVQRQRIIRSAGIVARRWGKDTKRGWGSEEEYHTFDDAAVILSQREDRDSSVLLAELEQTTGLIEATEEAIEIAESEYIGWSRYFVVTSSNGHIHSSMRCTTCYATTTYGWMPELSGSTEEAAVKVLGTTLCSECFKSAPVAHQGDKLTAKEAEVLAWSPDRDEKAARREADRVAKAEAKAKKAANKLKRDETVAHKVNILVDRFGEDHRAALNYVWYDPSCKGYDTALNVYKDMLGQRVFGAL